MSHYRYGLVPVVLIALCAGCGRLDTCVVTSADETCSAERLCGRDAAVSPGTLTVTEVPAFRVISSRLVCGAQPEREGFEQLRRCGIKTVVSLRTTRSDAPDLAGLGFRYYRLSVKHFHPETEDVLAFLKIVQAPENQPVFVHCQSGMDRTGMMVAGYRMVIEDWSQERALEEMKLAGFHSHFLLIERYVRQLDVQAMRKKLQTMQPPEVEVIP